MGISSIERTVSPEHRTLLASLLLEHAMTLDNAVAWLADRQYRISRSAVARWKKAELWKSRLALRGL